MGWRIPHGLCSTMRGRANEELPAFINARPPAAAPGALAVSRFDGGRGPRRGREHLGTA